MGVVGVGSVCNDSGDIGIGGHGVMIIRVMTTVIRSFIGILNFVGRSKGEA